MAERDQDIDRLARALEAVLPAASYGASVANQISKPGYSAMVRAVKEARSLLRDIRPGALLCRQSDHVFQPRWDGRCDRCRGEPPGEGPFTWSVEDLERDISRAGATSTEKGAKSAASHALNALGACYGNRLTIRPGIFANIVAPDGRRWELNRDWRGGCSWWVEAPAHG